MTKQETDELIKLIDGFDFDYNELAGSGYAVTLYNFGENHDYIGKKMIKYKNFYGECDND